MRHRPMRVFWSLKSLPWNLKKRVRILTGLVSGKCFGDLSIPQGLISLVPVCKPIQTVTEWKSCHIRFVYFTRLACVTFSLGRAETQRRRRSGVRGQDGRRCYSMTPFRLGPTSQSDRRIAVGGKEEIILIIVIFVMLSSRGFCDSIKVTAVRQQLQSGKGGSALYNSGRQGRMLAGNYA